MKRPSISADWAWGAALALLTFLAYLPSLHGKFIWDDSVMVAGNAMLRTPAGLRDFWFSTRAVDPLPLTMSALWLQWHCWRGNPAGYHIVDVLAHAAGALLLWRVLRRFTSHPRLSWVAAAVFALHPVAVASAGWISEQKNTLSIVFYLLCILCWLKFAGGGRAGMYWLSLVLFLGALLSKGSVVMLPVVLLLLTWWREGRITLRDAWAVAPFFLLSFASGLATIWIQNHKAIGGSVPQDLSGPARLAAAAWAVWFYVWKGLCPIDVCAIYPNWRVNAGSVAAWLPLAALTAAFIAAWWYRRSWGRHVLLGLGCFVITLFPVMGFFDMFFLNFSRVADHWQYAALPALLALAVCGGGHCLEAAAAKWRLPALVGPLLCAAILLALFAATWTRAGLYTGELALWADTVKKNPAAWMAWNNLGNALAADGRRVPAIAAYEKAIALNARYPDAESNLGNELANSGLWAEAVVHLQKAVEEEPQMARFHFNYGVGLAGLGRLEDAVAEYQTALSLHPGMASARNNLASVFIRQKKYRQALDMALSAMKLSPEITEPYLNAASALSALDRPDEAAGYYATYLRAHPENAHAHLECGVLLASHGDIAGAVPHFQAVVKLRPNDLAGHFDLGEALAALKRYAEAADEYHAALRLKPNDPDIQKRLDALPHS